jgi:hypothetical protein
MIQGKIKQTKSLDFTFRIVHTKLSRIFNKACPDIILAKSRTAKLITREK